MLMQCIFYAFTTCLSLRRFQVFGARHWRFRVVEISWDRTLSFTRTSGIWSWGGHVHVGLNCFFHFFQVFLVLSHKVIKLAWMFMFWLFLFLTFLSHKIVSCYNFFSTDFQFVRCFNFDEVAFGRLQMSAWRFWHRGCFL